MNEEQRQKWEEVRAKGKTRYILINGFLFQGLLTTVLFCLFQIAYVYFFDYDDFRRLSSRFPASFIITFIVFSVMGCVISGLSWHRTEKEFTKGFSN